MLKTYSGSRRSVGTLSPNYKWFFTHSIVVSYLHPRRVETDTSAFRSAIFQVSSVEEMSGKTHQEERIHPVLMPHWHFVDVDDGSIPAAWNAAVRLDRTEYLPPMLTIALISRETKRDEQRLDCFRPVHVQLAHSQGVVEEVSRRAGACIVRHTVGALRRWGNAVMRNQRVLIPEWRRGPYPAPLMYQSPGAFNTPSRLSLGILKCAISGASPLRDHSTNDPATRK